jgi:FixJ family two-component response regulator
MSEAPLISIVDDDALARDGIRELVESLGYNAVTFKSAEHFLESSLVADTTCLITDVQMPDLNGLELQETLQSRGYSIPVILVTAYANEKNRTRALDNGAVGYLSKPFDDESLIECLSAAIKSRSSQERQESSDVAIINKDLDGTIPAVTRRRSACSGIWPKRLLASQLQS